LSVGPVVAVVVVAMALQVAVAVVEELFPKLGILLQLPVLHIICM